MTTVTTRSCALGALALAFCTSTALADDLFPPPWRYTAGSTFQHWDFHSGASGMAPDGAAVNNIYGPPLLHTTNPGNWLPSFSGRNDVWAVNDFDFLRFEVPNELHTSMQKELLLQVTYLSPTLGLGIQITSPNGNFTQVGAPTITPLPGGWIHETSRWTLNSCPGVENVFIQPPVPGTVLFVDQVVIDTRCIPSPGAGAMIAMGALLAARRRRRA